MGMSAGTSNSRGDERIDPIRLLVIGLLVIIVVIIITAIVWAAYADSQGLEGPFRMMGFGGFGWIFLLIPLTFIIVLIIVIATAGSRRPAGPYYWHWGPMWHDHYYGWNDALGILNERYAKGEITREEYQRMREDLERDYRPR
jgi:putative membrane protein